MFYVSGFLFIYKTHRFWDENMSAKNNNFSTLEKVPLSAFLTNIYQKCHFLHF